MNVANLYRKLRQVLNESNAALSNRGFNRVRNLSEILPEIESHGEINRLPYWIRDEIVEMTEEDFNGMTKIGNYAFCDSNSLRTIRIPDSVTLIEKNAFVGNGSIYNIYLNSTTPPILEDGAYIRDAITVRVPRGSIDAYKNATNWANCWISEYDVN